MKKSIAVRVGLSAIAIVAAVAGSIFTTPVATLVSGNAALGQMTNSDSSYLASMAAMNLGAMLNSSPMLILLAALLLIWGTAFFNNKN